MARVSVYIDGFNVYFGIVALMERRHLSGLKWLDYWSLSQSLMTSSPAKSKGDTLVAVKYFTALVEDDEEAAARHAEYLTALKHMGVEVIEGKYLTHRMLCKNPNCGRLWVRGEEKQTDVAIGTYLLDDAYQDTFDKAILVTGDSDQTPTLRLMRIRHPLKPVVLAYPPARGRNQDLERELPEGYTMRFNGLLQQCQLPNPVPTPSGHVHCPESWL